jgi:two-component system response regulator PilR (NtrC family)
MVSGSTDLDPQALRTRLRVWQFARVTIVTVFLGALAASDLSEPNVEAPLRGITLLIVIAYVASVASAFAVPRVRRLHEFALGQVVFDIILNSAAVLLTGSLLSPMAVWYNLAIMGAAFVLRRHGAYVAAAISSITYGVLMNLVYYHALPTALGIEAPAPEPGLGLVYHIAANIASFFSIAYLSSVLVERVASTQEKLRASEENFQRIDTLQRVLVQNLESGVLTTDADGVIRSTNQAVETIIGRPTNELVGRRISEVFPVLRPSVGAKRLLDFGPIPMEMAHRARPDAEEQTLRCTGAPLTDTYQNLIGSLFILQDVTALKKLSPEAEPEPTPDELERRAKVPQIVGFLGHSQRMQHIVELIHKVAPTESTVLITGESGTGKELAARAIHSLSARRDKAMVVVNCGAIPANLIESELFGHVRGAFTGAVADRRGLFRSADGGTIFLDEVGDLPLALQVKLLRVLQERSFTPVGGQAQVAVDVRIIAATNRDLETEVAAGNFREDLFYRLNVIRVQMPPLRERTDDLPVLIDHFLARFSESLRRPQCKLSSNAMRRLLAHTFPGNIRELENIIEHAVALAESDTIREDDLPLDMRNGTPSGVVAPMVERPAGADVDWMQGGSSNLDKELEAIERRLLEEALRRAGGVRKKAAEILGINYRSLRHRLSKYGFGDVEARE